MKLLIIHDRPEIAAELEAIAKERVGASGIVHLARDVFNARDLLRETYYDLAVIDLTLPMRSGRGEATLANTQHLLEEIFEGDAKAPGDVVGISLDTTVLDSVKTTIGHNIMASIEEDSAGRWRDAFKAKLDYVQRAGRSRQLVLNSSHDVDVVILTALDKEATPWGRLFELHDSAAFARAKEFVFASREGKMRRGVLYSVGQAGQAPCGSAAQALLSQFRPQVMLMTGFCGGVKSRVALGDLVAFRSSHAWDYGKWVEKRDAAGVKTTTFCRRPTPINVNETGLTDIVRDMITAEAPLDPTLVAELTTASKGRRTSWKIRQAAAGSGSAVVTSLKKLDQIVAGDENIWAVDMESYAFYYACRNTPVVKPDFMCIKAVADHCNGAKSSRLHDVCCSISAAFAHEILTKQYDFS